MKRFACLALLAAIAPAQQTFVVGAGGQFSDIPAAISAAQHGDILVVRAGNYATFSLNKALRIIGDPGATIVGLGFHGFGPTFTVRDIPAGLPAVVRGFAMPTGGGLSSSYVTVADCAGPVHIDSVAMSGSSLFRITNSAQVSVHACFFGAVTIDNSVALLTETSAQGFGSILTGGPAAVITSSRVVIVGGRYAGGAGLIGDSAPAVILQSGRLVVTGAATTTLTAGSPSTTPVPAIQAVAGELILDPTPTLTPAGGSPPVSGGAAFTQIEVPALQVVVAGRTMTTTLRAAPGGVVFLLASPFSPVLPLPVMDLWVGFTHIVIAQGPVPGTGVRVDVTNLPRLSVGTTSPLQAVVLRGTGFVLSNPVISRWD